MKYQSLFLLEGGGWGWRAVGKKSISKCRPLNFLLSKLSVNL